MQAFDRRSIRRAGIVSVLIFAGFLLVVIALLSRMDTTGFGRLWQLGAPLLLTLLGLSLLNYLLRGLRWWLFTTQLRLDVPAGHNASYYVAGFLMTPTPGKLGELLRLWLIRRGHDEGYHRSLPLILGDRVGDTYGMIVLCILSGALLGQHGEILALSVVGLTMLTLMLLYPQPLIGLVGQVYLRFKRAPRLFAGLRHAVRQLSALMTPAVALPALLLSLGGWIAECVALQWLLVGLGHEISLLQAIFAFSFSMVLGGLSMLPGGLGATEAGLAFVLIGFGVEPAIALLATALIRITTLWFAVALGALAMPLALHLSRPAAEAATA